MNETVLCKLLYLFFLNTNLACPSVCFYPTNVMKTRSHDPKGSLLLVKIEIFTISTLTILKIHRFREKNPQNSQRKLTYSDRYYGLEKTLPLPPFSPCPLPFSILSIPLSLSFQFLILQCQQLYHFSNNMLVLHKHPPPLQLHSLKHIFFPFDFPY